MFKEVREEMQQVTWPSHKEWTTLSRLTLVIMAVSGVALFAFDVASSAGVAALLSL